MASLRRKPNSKFWIACFTTADGRQTQRSTKTTDRRLALRLANEFETEARTRRTAAQARRVISDIHKEVTGTDLEFVSARDYFTTWLAAKAPSVAKSTNDAYKAVVTEFLTFLRDRADEKLIYITTQDIIAFRDDNAARLAPTSTNNKLKILRIAFQDAWRDNTVDTNVAAKVPNVKTRKTSVRRPFTIDEIRSLLKAADHDWKGTILFGLYTGQRIGDIVRLTLGDIDREKGILTLDSIKTRRRQILPLAPALLAWLRDHPWGTKSTDHLFPKFFESVDRTGKVGKLSNQFHDLMAQAGLVPKRSHQKRAGSQGRNGKRQQSELTFHCLRHTATSLMKNAGISPAIVQEFIGHDSKTISDNYTHIEFAALLEASRSMPDVASEKS